MAHFIKFHTTNQRTPKPYECTVSTGASKSTEHRQVVLRLQGWDKEENTIYAGITMSETETIQLIDKLQKQLEWLKGE